MKLQYRLFLLLGLVISAALFSCEKDTVTADLRIVESVTVAEVIDFQQEYLLEAIANSFDNQFLPFGVNRNYIDTNRLNQKFQLDFGKLQLCGDYISRTGRMTVNQFNSQSYWDSLVCEIKTSDSFGIQSEFGTIYVIGKFSLKRIDATQVISESNFAFYIRNGWDFKYNSTCIFSRLKKNPTKLDFNDGMIVNGISNLKKDNHPLNVKTEIVKVAKLVDGPNFPITGELSCLLNSGEGVQVSFDPYTNLGLDKVAKGKFGDAEWFFNFQ